MAALMALNVNAGTARLRQLSWPQMTCVLTGLQHVILGLRIAMNAADGATIEPRTRINQPDDENARCKGLRARDPHKDFSPCTQHL